MLNLLLGWGLAFEDALVDEIRDVVHHVFGDLSLSSCAVCRRQFRRRSLRNSSGVLGCGVHMLGDAARAGAALVLGLHFSMRSPQAPTASLKPSYVLGPRRVGVLHRAKAHRPCALRVPALGERAPALDQVVDGAASKTCSEEGFLDVGQELREEVVRACRFDDEDLFRGVLDSRLLGAAPVSTPVDLVAAASRTVGLGSPGAAAGVPLSHWGCRGHRCRGHVCRLGYRNGGGWGRCDRLTHYRGSRGRSGSRVVGVDRRGRGVGVVGCTGCVAPHRGVPVGGRGLVDRGRRGLQERAHAL
jgi:hypothetical protein